MRTDAGRDGRTCFVRTNSHSANGVREENIFPVQLIKSRIVIPVDAQAAECDDNNT